MKLPVHAQALRHVAERLPDLVDIRRGTLQAEHSPHKKTVGRFIVKLFKRANVAIAIGQKATNGGNNPRVSAAGGGEYVVAPGIVALCH
jgi:hypothetical protein